MISDNVLTMYRRILGSRLDLADVQRYRAASRGNIRVHPSVTNIHRKERKQTERRKKKLRSVICNSAENARYARGVSREEGEGTREDEPYIGILEHGRWPFVWQGSKSRGGGAERYDGKRMKRSKQARKTDRGEKETTGA